MMIALLDNGICDAQISTKTDRIDLLNDAGDVKPFSHGTICAAIIEKYGAADRFTDIRFLDSNDDKNIDRLIEALECCYDLRPDIINLSCGIENYMEDDEKIIILHRRIKQLKEKGIDIYAAQSNFGRKTIPADFIETISVEHKRPIRNILNSVYRTSDVYIKAPFSIRISGKRIYTNSNNSFDCAYACALASRNGLHINDTIVKPVLIPTLSSKINTPLIAINKSAGASSLAVYLKHKFLQEGYYVCIISDHNDGYPADIRYYTGECFKMWSARYVLESHSDLIIHLTDKALNTCDAEIMINETDKGSFDIFSNHQKYNASNCPEVYIITLGILTDSE